MVDGRGYRVLRDVPGLRAWAEAARGLAEIALDDQALRDRWLRHDGTWFVGVEALANDPDGSLGGVPLPAELRGIWPGTWHRAQLSAIYPGYPGRDPGESDAAHRFRHTRCGAHVDGLHLEEGRRVLREPHAFVLGIGLSDVAASPLVIWEGSQEIIRAALAGTEADSDVTEAYKAARADVFARCAKVEVPVRRGEAVLVNRLSVHGIAPWAGAGRDPRLMAYFRPIFARARDWTARHP
jgi:hypothetical protein